MIFCKYLSENILQNIKLFLIYSSGFIEQCNYIKIPCCCYYEDKMKPEDIMLSGSDYLSFSKIPRISNKIPSKLEISASNEEIDK